jgi:hypothetical protein
MHLVSVPVSGTLFVRSMLTAATPSTMNHLPATTIRSLMSSHRKTIAGLAHSMNITQKRVRQVRTIGVRGEAFVMDWMEAITGKQAKVQA